jgi:hypothetical protein
MPKKAKRTYENDTEVREQIEVVLDLRRAYLGADKTSEDLHKKGVEALSRLDTLIKKGSLVNV